MQNAGAWSEKEGHHYIVASLTGQLSLIFYTASHTFIVPLAYDNFFGHSWTQILEEMLQFWSP